MYKKQAADNKNLSYQKLVKAGVALARKKGLTGFSVRELCAKAGVNLGLFHYHFSSRDNFSEVLISNIYSVMMQDITLGVSPQHPPKDNLRTALLAINKFVAANRMVLSSLMADFLSGEKRIVTFLSKNMGAHISIILGELERAEKQKQLIEGLSLFNITVLLLPPLVLPYIVLGTMERISQPAIKPLHALLLKEKSALDVERNADILLNMVFKL